tara:strand:- start:5729 stop:5992 length:264 start_codon:yes stop_codon:yes gene_type:complete
MTEKELILYGVLNNYTGYTVNSSTKIVSINIEVAYNVDDIDERIRSLETEIQFFEEDQDINPEFKNEKLNSFNDELDQLKLLKEKLS